MDPWTDGREVALCRVDLALGPEDGTLVVTFGSGAVLGVAPDGRYQA